MEGETMTTIARARAGNERPESPPAPEAEPLVSLEDIRRAAANLAGVVLRTPLIPFGTAGPGGPRVLLKAESLQPIGAFKIRGAYHAIASLTP